MRNWWEQPQPEQPQSSNRLPALGTPPTTEPPPLDPWLSEFIAPRPAATEAPKLPAMDAPPSPGILSDIGNQLKRGYAGTAQGVNWLGSVAPGLKDIPSNVVDWQGNADYWRDQSAQASRALSPEQQAADKKQFVNDDYSLGDAWGDVRSYTGAAVESIPGTIAGMAIGGPIAAGLKGIGSALLPRMTAKVAERLTMGAGALGYGAGEGVVAAGADGAQARDLVLENRELVEKSSPLFRDLVAQGHSRDDALRMVADTAAQQVATRSGLTVGLLGAPMGAVFGKWFHGAGGERIGKTALGAIGIGAGGEALQEMPQSGFEQVYQNQAMRDYVNPEQALLAGVPDAVIKGGIAGGLMGGAMGTAGHFSQGQPVPQALPSPPESLPTDPANPAPVAPLPTPGGIIPTGLPADSTDPYGDWIRQQGEQQDYLNQQAPPIPVLDDALGEAAADPIAEELTRLGFPPPPRHAQAQPPVAQPGLPTPPPSAPPVPPMVQREAEKAALNNEVAQLNQNPPPAPRQMQRSESVVISPAAPAPNVQGQLDQFLGQNNQNPPTDAIGPAMQAWLNRVTGNDPQKAPAFLESANEVTDSAIQQGVHSGFLDQNGQVDPQTQEKLNAYREILNRKGYDLGPPIPNPQSGTFTQPILPRAEAPALPLPPDSRRQLGQGPLDAPTSPPEIPQGQTEPSGLVRPGDELARLLGTAPGLPTAPGQPAAPAEQDLTELLARNASNAVAPGPMLTQGGLPPMGAPVPTPARVVDERDELAITDTTLFPPVEQLGQQSPEALNTIRQRFDRWMEAHGNTSALARLPDGAASRTIIPYRETNLIKQYESGLTAAMDAAERAPRPKGAPQPTAPDPRQMENQARVDRLMTEREAEVSTLAPAIEAKQEAIRQQALAIKAEAEAPGTDPARVAVLTQQWKDLGQQFKTGKESLFWLKNRAYDGVAANGGSVAIQQQGARLTDIPPYIREYAGLTEPTPTRSPVTHPLTGQTTPNNAPDPADSSNAAQSPAETAPNLEELQTRVQMYEDVIKLRREQGQPVPQEWIDKYAAARQALHGEQGTEAAGISPLVVPGHPEHPLTDSSPLLRYGTVPLKVGSVEQIQNRLFEAQKMLHDAEMKYNGAEYQQRTAKNAADQRKAAKTLSDLQNKGITPDALDALRNETIPELNRLFREMEQRQPNTPTSAATASALQPQPEIVSDQRSQEGRQAQTEALLKQETPPAGNEVGNSQEQENVPDKPNLVSRQTVDGDTVWVRSEDLANPDHNVLPLYAADGKRLPNDSIAKDDLVATSDVGQNTEPTAQENGSPVAKEPWQMTRDEFTTANLPAKGEEFVQNPLVKRGLDLIGMPEAQQRYSWITSHNAEADKTVGEYGRPYKDDRQYLNVLGRYRQATKNPMKGNPHFAIEHHAHRALVEQAISEGKPVPTEVLADYPDLKPTVAPADRRSADAKRDYINQLPPDQKPQAIQRARFTSHADERIAQDTATFQQWGASPEDAATKAAQMADRVRDNLTGFDNKEARDATLERAIAHVGESKDRGFYVEADLRNLGGLNHTFGATGANTHFRAFTDLFAAEMRAIADADVSLFRHGGDEFAAVIVGNTTPEQVQSAIAAAERKVAEYVTEQGMADIPHPKHKGDATFNGTGITAAFGEIDEADTVKKITSDVDQEIERKKGQRDVNRSETQTTGPVASTRPAGSAPQGTGTAVGQEPEGAGNRRREGTEEESRDEEVKPATTEKSSAVQPAASILDAFIATRPKGLQKVIAKALQSGVDGMDGFTRADLIQQALEAGATVQSGPNGRMLGALTEKQLTKSGMDYAEYLAGQRNPESAPTLVSRQTVDGETVLIAEQDWANTDRNTLPLYRQDGTRLDEVIARDDVVEKRPAENLVTKPISLPEQESPAAQGQPDFSDISETHQKRIDQLLRDGYTEIAGYYLQKPNTTQIERIGLRGTVYARHLLDTKAERYADRRDQSFVAPDDTQRIASTGASPFQPIIAEFFKQVAAGKGKDRVTPNRRVVPYQDNTQAVHYALHNVRLAEYNNSVYVPSAYVSAWDSAVRLTESDSDLKVARNEKWQARFLKAKEEPNAQTPPAAQPTPVSDATPAWTDPGLLSSYSKADLDARTAAAEKAKAEQAAKDKAAAAKAAADEAGKTFTLAGSDRPADIAASRGQEDLLADVRPPAKPLRPSYQEKTALLETDDLLTAIAKLGGLRRQYAEAVDAVEFKRMPVFGKPVFRKNGGKTLDGLAEALHEAGYPVQDEDGNYNANTLMDRIHEALGGKTILTMAGHDQVMQRDAEERARMVEARDWALDDTDLEASGYTDLASVDQAIADWKVMASESLGEDAADALFERIAEKSTADTQTEFLKELQDAYTRELEKGRSSRGSAVQNESGQQGGADGEAGATTAREAAETKPESVDIGAKAEARKQAILSALTDLGWKSDDGGALSWNIGGSPKGGEINPYGNRLAYVETRGGNLALYINNGMDDPVYLVRQIVPENTDPKAIAQQFHDKAMAQAAPENRAKNELRRRRVASDNPAANTLTPTQTAAELAPTKPGTITNFGEALPGGRRRTAPSLDQELTDEAIATQPFSKIWPAEEVDAIEDTFVAAVAFAARAEVPAKPRQSYKLKRWVQQVRAVRELAGFMTSGNLTREAFIAKIKERGDLKDWTHKILLLEAIDRPQWKRIDKVLIYPDAYRFGENNQRIQSPMAQVTIDGKTHTIANATSVADVIDPVNTLLDVTPDAKKMQFEVRRLKGGEVFINKKGDPEYRKLKTFATAKEAHDFIQSNPKDLMAAWDAVKERDNVKETDVRRAENRPRTGADHRQGKDATDAMFMDAFGFRGVEFGKWVAQGENAKERQGMLNAAYDALLDLANLTGIPPKAISLNGSLGLAFGSRGSGWASAHFEPGNLVINLTKTRGAGSLAHEWFHALDNYFSRMRGGAVAIQKGLNAQQTYREQNYITYRPEPLYVHKTKPGRSLTSGQLEAYRKSNPNNSYFSAENWQPDPNHPQGVRPEVERAFTELVDALDASPMAARAKKNDKHSGGYWSQIIERAARSFENVLIARMAQEGYHNDYLANVQDIESFPRSKDRYPYLLPEEIAPVKAAFDNLFDTVQTRATEQGMQLFAQASTTSTLLTNLKALTGDKLVQGLMDNGRLNLVARQSQLPPIAAIPPGQRVAGWVHPETGAVYLIAENIAPGEIEGFLNHEVGVHQAQLGLNQPKPQALRLAHTLVRLVGAGQILGDNNFQAVLKQLQQLRARNVKSVVEAYAKAEKAMGALNQNDALLDEEALAYLVQEQRNFPLVRRIMAAIRAFLYRAGFKISLNENDLHALAVSATKNAAARMDGLSGMTTAGAMGRRYGGQLPGDVFYSALLRGIEGMSQKKAPGLQWASLLNNLAQKGQVKQEEMEWTGVAEWLKDQKRMVTKEEVIEFVRSNEIRVEEVELGKNFGNKLDGIGKWEIEKHSDKISAWTFTKRGAARPFATILSMDGGNSWKVHGSEFTILPQSILNTEYSTAESAQEAVNPFIVKFFPVQDAPRNTRWTFNDTAETGSQRELVLTIPTIKPWNTGDETHYGDVGGGRAVAWVRFNTRTDADGKRVLFIEEIQSKRHQEGRDKGYQESGDEFAAAMREVQDYKQRITQIIEEYGTVPEIQAKIKAIPTGITNIVVVDQDGVVLFAGDEAKRANLIEAHQIMRAKPRATLRHEYAPVSPKHEEQRAALQKKLIEIGEYQRLRAEAQVNADDARGLIPNAPFKATIAGSGQTLSGWAGLAFKRMLRYAAENGYERLAWTTGEQQAERYSLGFYVGKIASTRRDTGDYWIQTFDKTTGKRLVDATYTAKELPEVVGAEFAQKIINAPDGMQTWSGLDLQVGGDGMKGFYDRLLPAEINKYIKKWGAKVGQTAIDTGEAVEPVHSVDITPDMAASVLKGQPLFSQSREDIEAARQYAEVVAKYKGTPQWMKAPNGEPTKLNERQWVQVRTPAFKAWFGDWEGDPANASKVLDENGEPRVVFHGTASSGFSIFDTEKQRGVLNRQFQGNGFAFTANPVVADDYATAARNQTISRNAFLGAIRSRYPLLFPFAKNLIDVGYSAAWSEEQTDKITQLGERYGVDLNDFGDLAQYVEGSVSARSSDFSLFGGVQGLPEWVYETATRLGVDAPSPHIVPSFLSIRNPLITNDRGKARHAEAKGHDGLIYSGEGTVRGEPEFIAFSPTQIKSAIGNTGAFSPTNPDIRYSYAGEKAATADHSLLQQAKARVDAGEDAETVRKETGWFLNPYDKKWRFEIDDRQARLTINFADFTGRASRLSDVLDHPALFAAYPELTDQIQARIEINPFDSKKDGSLTKRDAITSKPQTYLIKVDAETRTNALSSLLHEVQHAIQDMEGFALGGRPIETKYDDATPDIKVLGQRIVDKITQHFPDITSRRELRAYVRDQGLQYSALAFTMGETAGDVADVAEALADFAEERGLDDLSLAIEDWEDAILRLQAGENYGQDKFTREQEAFKQYQSIAGEIEARDTQARKFLTPDERRDTAPYRATLFKDGIADSDVIVQTGGTDQRFAAANPAPGTPPQLTPPPMTRIETMQRAIQDRFVRFKTIQNWLKRIGINLTPDADVYGAEERSVKRFAARAEDFRVETLKPLVEAAAKAKYGLTGGDLLAALLDRKPLPTTFKPNIPEFLIAQHAPARNAQIAKINPAYPDGGSGLTNAQAADILAKYRALPNFAAFARMAEQFRAISEETKQLQLQAGLISQDMVDAWDAAYGNTYIPLKGGPEDGAQSGTGQGQSVNARQHRAMGHGLREENVLENIFRDRERALLLIEKNKVGLALKALLEQANNPEIGAVGQPEKQAVMTQGWHHEVWIDGKPLGAFQSYTTAKAAIAADSAATGRPVASYGVRHKASDPGVVYMTRAQLAKNEATVYINGERIRMQLNDEGAARAYNALGMDGATGVIKVGQGFNRYLSKAYTGFNPEFLAVNIARDFTAGLINLTGKYGADFAGKAVLNYRASFMDALRYAWDSSRSGNHPWIDRYRAAGGSTGAAYLSDLERIGKDVTQSFEDAQGAMETWRQGKPGAALRVASWDLLRKAFGWMEKFNMAGENAMRLATFRTAIEAGKSDEEAASAAANVTVNFNRRGEMGQHLSALYLFFNPNVQGTQVLLDTLINSPHKAQAWAMAGALTGLAVTLAGMARGGSDDDEKKWRTIPGHIKDRNMIIQAGDKQWLIPVPFGYGAFWALGNVISDKLHDADEGKGGIRLASALFQHFSPLGNPLAGDEADIRNLVGMMPTMTKIPLELAVNRNSFGSPVMPELQPWNPGQPASQRKWRDTNGTLFDRLAVGLNKAFGGSAYDSGYVDISPETMKKLFRDFSGGAGQFVLDGINLLVVAGQGVMPELKEWPIARKFAREGRIQDERTYYHSQAQHVKIAMGAFNAAKRAKDAAGIQTIAYEQAELLRLGTVLGKLTKAIQGRRELEQQITASDLPLAEKRKQLEWVQAQESTLYDLFDGLFLSAKKQNKERLAGN